MNTYAYAANDPLQLTDELGLRPLTSGETAIARSIFGDSIDYSEVDILQERFAGIIPVPSQRAMTPSGNIYFHPDNTSYRDDFSQADLDLQGLFIHEMVHAWQHQSGVNVIGGAIVAANRYRYELECGQTLTDDFNIEQQGNIIMDYFFRINNHETSAWGSQTRDPANTRDLYDDVLQDFLADPGYLQREIEERREEQRRPGTRR